MIVEILVRFTLPYSLQCDFLVQSNKVYAKTLKEYIYSTDLFQLRKICKRTYYNIGNAKNKIKYIIYKIVKKNPMKNLKITFTHSCRGGRPHVSRRLCGGQWTACRSPFSFLPGKTQRPSNSSAGLRESTFTHWAISPGQEKLSGELTLEQKPKINWGKLQLRSYERGRINAKILKRSTSGFFKHEEGQRTRENRARNGGEGPSRIGGANKKCIMLQTYVDTHSQKRKLNSDLF